MGGEFECSKFLLSDEIISGAPWDRDIVVGKNKKAMWLKNFKANILNLKQLFPSATIVCCVRRPGDLLLSMYSQYINEGGCLKFEDFYGYGKVIEKSDLDIKERVLFLKKNFENVHVLSFEDYANNITSFFDHYFVYCHKINRIKEVSNSRSNPSLKGGSLEIKRKINLVYRYFPNSIKFILFKLKINPRKIMQKIFVSPKFQYSDYQKKVKLEVNEFYDEDFRDLKATFMSNT
jgi:hypothetical protein